MTSVLITGANGQLGSELRNHSGLFKNMHPVFTDVDVLDITDKTAVLKFCADQGFRYIINCAAYTAVDRAEKEPDLARKINVGAVRNLAEVARILDAFLIHVSTDYVFAGNNFLPYREEDPVAPLSVYGITKAEGEQEALRNDNAIVVRTSWLYSSFGNNFVKTILRLLNERDKITVISDQVGTPTYAGDLAKAIISMVNFQEEHGKKPGIYHFSNEGVCSWYDFAYEIAQLTGSGTKVLPIGTKDYPSATPRPYYSVLNKSKIKSTFDITIPHWKESLQLCLKEIKM